MNKSATSASHGLALRVAEMRRALWRAADRGSLGWFSGALVLVVVGSVVAGLAPLMLKRLVDVLTGPEPTPGLQFQAPTFVALYVAAMLFQRLCEQAQAYAYGRGEQRLTRRLGVQAFAHTLTLPLGYHLGTKSGALAQTLSEGVLGARLILTHAVLTIAPAAIQIAVAAAVMGSLFGLSSVLVLLGALAGYSAVFARGVARQGGAARLVSASQIDAGGIAADGLMNVETIKAFTAEGRFAARYDGVLGSRERQWGRFLARRFENGVAVAAIFGLTLGATLFFASRAVAAGELTVGSFVLLNAYLLQLVRPLEMLGFAVRDIGQGLAYLERLLALLQQAPEGGVLRDHARQEQATTDAAELAFENVSFEFDGERPGLCDVSFRATPGALIGIVGPSGSGKSTLLRLVLRLYEPKGGRILLDGRPIAELPLAALRGQIALVSQDTILLNDTILANIAFAMEDAADEDVVLAARAAKLSDLLEKLPDGLNTPVGERGLRLSGGEKQRVSIARAALKQARLILFDEATAALDPPTEREVWDAVQKLARGATIVVVTHRLSTVVGADEILMLEGGRIVEQGRHADLFARGGAYRRLWASQETEPDRLTDPLAAG